MKPRPFDYVRPDTVEEALALLAEYGDDARILAGGQSLIPMLNLRLIEAAVLIDISRIGELDGIRLGVPRGQPHDDRLLAARERRQAIPAPALGDPGGVLGR